MSANLEDILKKIERIKEWRHRVNGKREFEPRDQVFPELVFSCSL